MRSMKDAGIFLGREKNTYCTFQQLKSAKTYAQFTVGVRFFWIC